MTHQRLKALAWLLGKIGISVGLLYVAFHKIDLSSLSQDLRSIRIGWLALAAAQLLLIPLLGGARWKLVLRALGSSFGLVPATRLFWIGMVFNQVLPSLSGGDAVRVVIVWRGGLPLARAIHSVILERVAVVFSLVALVAMMQILATRQVPYAAGVFVPVMFLSAVTGVVFLMAADRIGPSLPRWRVISALCSLSTDSRRLFLSSAGAQLLLLSALTQLNFAMASLWLGKSLGLPLQLGEYLYYIPIVTLIATLPLSIGGWGVRESATVALFGTIGVADHSALAFSVLSGLMVTSVSLLGLPFIWISKVENLRAPAMKDLMSLERKDGNVITT